ncbi:FAD-binding domain-containing protein [Metabacillus indicus]|uniref:FAD-binding domain-containing protein n=1 Tax=Metabacillus indicus TaxID=246786 RepID=UPI00068EF9F9|nr:FAD-binding domain-containing protein [Metabacillus indicus]
MNVVWFKRDLRTEDHTPLAKAARFGEVLPLYAAEPSVWGTGSMSARHFQFVRESLEDMQYSFEKMGGSLYTFTGEIEDALEAIYEMCSDFSLHAYRESRSEAEVQKHTRVREWMTDRGLAFHEYEEYGAPGKNAKQRWEAFVRSEGARMPSRLFMPEKVPDRFYSGSEKLKSLPVKGSPIKFGQQGGEVQALETLDTFLNERAASYLENRSNPLQSTISSSRLSPYLAWGNISLRTVVQKTSIKIENCDNLFPVEQLTAFMDQLKARWKLMDSGVEAISELCLHDERPPLFDKWHAGETGIPFADACMKCLHKTGWLPAKYRGMLASFGIAVLKLDPAACSAALASLFLDYEPAIHSGQMKKVASKVVNPVKTGKTEDPDGVFIRRYLPVLEHVPAKYIHEPWNYPGFFQMDYQAPVIDLKKAIKPAKKGTERKNKPSDSEQLSFDL